MRGTTIDLTARRRVFLAVLVLALLVAVALPTARALTSSTDVAGAVAAAETDAAMITASGMPATTAQLYAEPRYLIASQGPLDLAGASIALALLALVGGAALTGGDWRTGAVTSLVPDWRRRARPLVSSVLAWVALASALAVTVLATTACGLLLAAHLRGSITGLDMATLALVAGRGTLVAGVAASVGAGLGTALRTDVLVVVAVLVEVLAAELLAPSLAPGWQTPGARLVAFLLSPTGEGRLPECDTPVCAAPIVSGAGSPAGFAVLIGVAVTAIALAGWAARRPVWR